MTVTDNKTSTTVTSGTRLPRAQGYMRVPDGAHDDVVEIILNRLNEYAGNHGFEMDEIHFEYGNGRTDVKALRSFLRRTDATHVIIPSIDQITEHVAIQAAVTSTIVLGAGAVLHQTADEPTGR